MTMSIYYLRHWALFIIFCHSNLSMLLSILLLSWQTHLKAQSYVRKAQNIVSICMYQLARWKLSSQEKGGPKLCLQPRHLEYSCIFYKPTAVKQNVLLFLPPQTKEQDKRCSLWLFFRSGLQNTCAHCLETWNSASC